MHLLQLSSIRQLTSGVWCVQQRVALFHNHIQYRSISHSSPRNGADSVPKSSPATSKEPSSQVSVNNQTDQKHKPLPNDGEDKLTFLNRPLGVPDKPTTEVKTWEQTRLDLMDQEKRMAQRKHLIKEATKGYFSDLNATRRHGGKTWIAPRVMIREDKALYFPDIIGTSLVSSEKVHTTQLLSGKVSIIAMLSTKISELHTQSFVRLAREKHSMHPAFQYIQMNLQENLLKSLLVSLFKSNIKKSVPEELWSKYLISSQNIEYVRDDLGMTNRHVGYVYLVDPHCKIRWGGCADAKPEETAALQSCTTVLLGRLDNNGKGVSAPASVSTTLNH